MASRAQAWGKVKPQTNGTRFDDVFDKFDIPEDYTRVRFVGGVYEFFIHWVPTMTKQGKPTAYMLPCRHNNGADEQCPMCKAGIRKQSVYFTNAIIRDIQEDEPKKKGSPDKGQEFRKKGDKWWSPIRVIQLPPSVVQKIVRLSEQNKVKVKDKKTGDVEIRTFDIDHPKYGRDLSIMKDTSQSGSGMYDIQKEEVSPLTEEEKAYLLYELDAIYNCISSEEEMLADLVRGYERDVFDNENCNLKVLQKMIAGKVSSNDDDEDEDEDERPRKKKDDKKPKKHVEEDDDLDDENDDIDDEDEEEEKPKKKAKPASKPKKKPVDDDEDLDDDDEDEDESSDLDDDDEDEDESSDLDDDDEEDEAPKKGKSKPSKQEKPSKKSKKPADDEDDDEDVFGDDEVDDDDEEDEAPKKKAKPAKSKKDADEDDDLDGLDDDEDEEEEKPKKKKSKK